MFYLTKDLMPSAPAPSRVVFSFVAPASNIVPLINSIAEFIHRDSACPVLNGTNDEIMSFPSPVGHIPSSVVVFA